MASFNQSPLGQASVTTTLDDFSLSISGTLPVRTRENIVSGASVQYTTDVVPASFTYPTTGQIWPLGVVPG